MQNSLQEKEQENKSAINQIKKDYEKHLTKLNEEVENLTNELLASKRKELAELTNQIKNQLDHKLHGYLEILLLMPDKNEVSEKAKQHLLNQVNGNDLQKLVLLQHQVNHLKKRSNELTQIEILPPTYTRH